MGRGQGSKAKATSNFGANRDLNGRRLRHVEQEKELAEWLRKAPERELEKLMEKERKRQESASVHLEVPKDYHEAVKTTTEMVQNAVTKGIENHKRNAEELEAIAAQDQAKRIRGVWMHDEL